MKPFYLRVKPFSTTKIVISVSKKVSKSAVVRNTIKRRVRPVVREIMINFKPAEYFIIARPGSNKVKGEELRREIESLFVSCRL